MLNDLWLYEVEYPRCEINIKGSPPPTSPPLVQDLLTSHYFKIYCRGDDTFIARCGIILMNL